MTSAAGKRLIVWSTNRTLATEAARRAGCLVATLALMFFGAAFAQTPAVPMPPDLKVRPSAADVPATVARFVGAWGRGAWDGVLPHVLVVETVDRDGRAQVVYALGDSGEANVTRGYRRVAARIVGDLLTFDVGDAALAYHIDGDSLRGTFTSARRRYTVTLTRVTLAEATATPARVPGEVTGTTVRIPSVEQDGTRITLEATLYRPAGSGPHPVLVFNHGSTGGGTVALSTTMRPSRQARFFIDHGFAMLAPMRRGRGASDGAHQEYEGTCAADVLGAGLARAIEDVDATMAYLRPQPWADAERVVVAGQSRGGLLSVAYAAQRPGTVRGVINFAGGWTTQRCDDEGRGFNQPTFVTAGRHARIPMLWLYAEDDSYYSAASIRRYHDAFAQAGGIATFRLFPAFGSDGHRLVDRREIWAPAVDDYLKHLNLVTR